MARCCGEFSGNLPPGPVATTNNLLSGEKAAVRTITVVSGLIPFFFPLFSCPRPSEPEQPSASAADINAAMERNQASIRVDPAWFSFMRNYLYVDCQIPRRRHAR